MNCTEAQRIDLELGGRDLPADCLEHLVSCAACREAHRRTVLVCNLIALKKYERPDPHFEVRNAAAIRRRLEAGEGDTPWGRLLLFRPSPVYVWAAAAVAVLAMGVSLYLPFGGEGGAPALVQDPPVLPIETAPSFLVSVPEPEPLGYQAPVDKPIFLFEAPSNRQPSGLQYGNGPSRLVGFEY